jgi:hypothetical protein
MPAMANIRRYSDWVGMSADRKWVISVESRPVSRLVLVQNLK